METKTLALTIGTTRGLIAIVIKGVAYKAAYIATRHWEIPVAVEASEAAETAAAKAANFHILAAMGLALGKSSAQGPASFNLGGDFDNTQNTAFDAANNIITRLAKEVAGDRWLEFLSSLTSSERNSVKALDEAWKAARKEAIRTTHHKGDEPTWTAAYNAFREALGKAIAAAEAAAKTIAAKHVKSK